MLGRFAEAVEEHEEEDGDESIDEGSDAKMQGEPGLRLREQKTASQRDESLVDAEESDRQSEARCGMLGIEACTNRRS